MRAENKELIEHLAYDEFSAEIDNTAIEIATARALYNQHLRSFNITAVLGTACTIAAAAFSFKSAEWGIAPVAAAGLAAGVMFLMAFQASLICYQLLNGIYCQGFGRFFTTPSAWIPSKLIEEDS